MLDRTFDFGQAYVALSRVKSLEGLWLSSPILPKHVKVNPTVMEFYKRTVNQGPPLPSKIWDWIQSF